jgi:hypothetical protein
MKHIKLYEEFEENTLNDILDKISEKGLLSLTSNEMYYLKSGGKPLNDVDISFKEFKTFFQPLPNDYAKRDNASQQDINKFFMDYVLIDSVEEFRKMELVNPYKVWTLLNSHGTTMNLVNGLYHYDRLGYVLCSIPWKEGDDYTIKL